MFQGTNAEKEAGRWGEAQSAAKKIAKVRICHLIFLIYPC